MVSDFGLSRPLQKDEDDDDNKNDEKSSNVYQYKQMTKDKELPIQSLAPETLGKSFWTAKSDVWSYGENGEEFLCFLCFEVLSVFFISFVCCKKNSLLPRNNFPL